jgi:hypothetical protein
MVNVVLGRFMSLLSNFTTSGSVPEEFMATVQETALVQLMLLPAQVIR